MTERGEDVAGAPGGGVLNVSGAVTLLLGTALPLGSGVVGGWPASRALAYAAVALPLVIILVGYLSSQRLSCWLEERIAPFLGLCGLAATALLVIGGDPYVQPIVFTVPFVIAVLALPPARAVGVGALYTLLIGVGLWLGGERDVLALLAAAGAYGAAMLFMFAMVRVALEQGRLAAENARLGAENAKAATLAERTRIARELHDTIAQGLTALSMQLEAAQRAFDRDPERARARLGRAQELAREALVDVRRSVWALAEQPLDGAALTAALGEQAARFRVRNGVSAVYHHEGPPLDLPAERAAHLLRIVQEALQNVEKHASASRVEIGSRRDSATTVVWVRDNGRGFDVDAPPQGPGGFGLVSLRERARLAGGALEVASAPRAGTTVRVVVLDEPGGR